MSKASEFTQIAGTRSVLLVQPYGANTASLAAKLASDKTVQVVECATIAEAVDVARKASVSLILCSAAVPNDLMAMINLMKGLVDGIKRRTVRVVLTMKFKQEDVEVKLMKMGCAEIIHEPIADKTFQFKLDRHVKSLPVAKESSSKFNDKTSDKTVAGASAGDPNAAGGAGKAGGAKARAAGNRATMVEPLTTPSDCFTLTPDEPKKFAGRWIIKFFGPPPSVGKWIKADMGGALAWQWKPNDPATDPFIKDADCAWYFKGNRPEFQADSWMFVASKPTLALLKGGGKGEMIAARVVTDDASGAVMVARDSDHSRKAYFKVKELLEIMLKSKGDDKKGGGYGRGGGDDDSGPAATDVKVEMLPPLELKSDCYLLQGRETRQVAGRWLTRLTGPGPTTGRWDPLKVEGSAEEYWQWIPGERDNPFITEPGAWIFRGNLPRFQDDGWNFSGKKPELSFRHEGKVLALKLKCEDPKTLGIAGDSKRALELLPQIMASIDKAVQTSGEKKPEDEDGSVIGDRAKQGEDEDEGEGADGKPKDSGDDGEDLPGLGGKLGGKGKQDAERDASVKGDGPAADGDDDDDDGEPGASNGEPKKKDKKTATASADDDEVLPGFKSSEETGETTSRKPKKKRDRADPDDDARDVDGGDDGGSDQDGDETQAGERWGKAKGPREKKSKDRKAENDDGNAGQEIRKPGAPAADDEGDEDEDLPKSGQGADLVAAKKKRVKGEAAADEGSEDDAAAAPGAEKAARKARKRAAGEPADTLEGRQRAARDEKPDQGDLELRSEGDEDAAAWGLKNWNEPKAGRPDVSKPLVSPLALAFLMSELIGKPDRALDAVARKYASYVSASLGELRVEVWLRRAGEWSMISAHDSSGAEFTEALGKVPDTEPFVARLATPEIAVAPIVSGAQGIHESLIGAIVVGGPASDIAKLSLAYLEATSEMARGLLKSMLESVASAA